MKNETYLNSCLSHHLSYTSYVSPLNVPVVSSTNVELTQQTRGQLQIGGIPLGQLHIGGIPTEGQYQSELRITLVLAFCTRVIRRHVEASNSTISDCELLTMVVSGSRLQVLHSVEDLSPLKKPWSSVGRLVMPRNSSQLPFIALQSAGSLHIWSS